MSHELFVSFILNTCSQLRLFAQKYSAYLYIHPHSGNNTNEIAPICSKVSFISIDIEVLFTKTKKWNQSIYLVDYELLKNICCVFFRQMLYVKKKRIYFSNTDPI